MLQIGKPDEAQRSQTRFKEVRRDPARRPQNIQLEEILLKAVTKTLGRSRKAERTRRPKRRRIRAVKKTTQILASTESTKEKQ